MRKNTDLSVYVFLKYSSIYSDDLWLNPIDIRLSIL